MLYGCPDIIGVIYQAVFFAKGGKQGVQLLNGVIVSRIYPLFELVDKTAGYYAVKLGKHGVKGYILICLAAVYIFKVRQEEQLICLGMDFGDVYKAVRIIAVQVVGVKMPEFVYESLNIRIVVIGVLKNKGYVVAVQKGGKCPRTALASAAYRVKAVLFHIFIGL